MKSFAAAAAILALAAAQSITDIPSCALQCVAEGVTATGCGLTDFACSCAKADQLTPNVTPCVQQACTSTEDQSKVITVLEGICASAGVPINLPNPGSPGVSVSVTFEGGSSAAPETSAPAAVSSSKAPASSAAASTSAAPAASSSAAATPASSSAYVAPTSATKAAEDSCAAVTVTVTSTISKYPSGTGAASLPAPISSEAPYPSAVSSGKPAGTGAYSLKPSASSPAQFTGAASALNVPAAAAAVFGIAALFV